LIETSIKDPRDVLREIINDYPEIRKGVALDAGSSNEKQKVKTQEHLPIYVMSKKTINFNANINEHHTQEVTRLKDAVSTRLTGDVRKALQSATPRSVHQADMDLPSSRSRNTLLGEAPQVKNRTLFSKSQRTLDSFDKEDQHSHSHSNSERKPPIKSKLRPINNIYENSNLLNAYRAEKLK